MFDFDEPIELRGTHSLKWDQMERLYGVPAADGLPMWVADMDFRAPPAVNDALMEAAQRGVHGYFGDEAAYRAAICGWMARRHGWEVDPEAIATVHGVVAGLATALRAWSAPGDRIILFTPVYHAFARVIKATGREVVDAPMTLTDGRYDFDLEALAAGLTGRERMLVFCSPHNPGGRIWEPDEQRSVAAFCAAHDLVLVCDEIHHDLILPGERHTPMPLVAPEHLDRLVMMTAATKAFNIAGALTGNVIIPDPKLRSSFAAAHRAGGTSVNRMGVLMATAAYESGDAWMDALRAYLGENARAFAAGVEAIPGVRMTRMQATYLAWADFSGAGMDDAEITERVRGRARIAASDGPTFGTGGARFLRFNIGTRRALVDEAVARLREAFSDLQ